ncbi:MAG: PRC-barrel domain-containing protein [Candidatus Promineifilaceae bacterium]
MFLGKDIIGNPLITISDGRSIGNVKDIYLTPDLQFVAGIYLGTEGLFSRRSLLVKSENVVTLGKDAVLVKHDEVTQEEKDFSATEKTWLRRDDLQGRTIDTPGGTKVGRVGDVIINREGKVLGFSLSQVYISGPIADNHSVAIHTVQDVGNEDGVMTIDLEQAEQQKLNVT